MTYVISIDPGAVHCGIAYWERLPPSTMWRCAWAVEMTPEDCVDYVQDLADAMPEQVICEGFWLDPNRMRQQIGSTMETVEVIGTLKHLCRWMGVPFNKVANGQDAIISRLTGAGYTWVSRGHGRHAKDAEAVGVRGLALSVSALASVQENRDRLEADS